MNKREFMKLSAAAGVGAMVLPGTAFGMPNLSEGAPFQLPQLGYAYSALVPYIDEETMKIHHSKHFQGYTDKLNAAVKGTAYEGKSIEHILKNVTASEGALRNNGGGYYNHSLFFASLSPSAKALPEGKLQKEIVASFGSYEAFLEQFNNSAKTVFGSGWTWLVCDAKGKLSIVSTPNQDSPLMAGILEKSAFPLLGIDVWEHAYYLKYQNRRNEYVDAFWKVLDWEYVEKRYKSQ